MAADNREELFQMGVALLKAAGARVRDGKGEEVDVQRALARTAKPSSRKSMIVSPNGEPYHIEGVGPENWFGPFEPLQPGADSDGPKGARGRRYDYPVGVNVNFRPRAEEPITFSTLRGIADAFDLLRLVIETRKDQIASYEWEIVPRKPDDKGQDSAIKQVTEFLEKPDREHTWQDWARMVLEDVLVVDGVCIYPRKTRGGQPWSFDLIDPATIKRFVDVEGRTPEPPSPAYQQILKGVPAVDYTTDELCYLMRNKRTWKNYGYSPVEQVLVTVNIALRRQTYQLQYYTDGNVPDAMIGVAESWTPEQIKEFQDQWDSILSGQQGMRRKVKFMPEWKSMILPRDTQVSLSGEFDEWLARLVCYAFSVPPISLVKMVNRAAGQQISDEAKEQGLMPFLRWFESHMSTMIWTYLGAKGVKFQWKMTEDVDPVAQANIRSADVRSGVISIDEARDQIGMEARGVDELILVTASGPIPLKEALDKAKEDILHPPEPPAFGPDGQPMPPQNGKPGEQQQGKPGFPPKGGKNKAAPGEPGQAVDAEKSVHVHLGDTIIRVPPADMPDVNVNLGGVDIFGSTPARRRVVKKKVIAKRDPDTGDLFGEVTEEEEDEHAVLKDGA